MATRPRACPAVRVSKSLGVVALVQLARRLAPRAVDHAAALARPGAGRSASVQRSTLRVLLHLQELARSVELALGERAVPGPDRHVGDRVVVAGEIRGSRRGAGRARRAGASPPWRSGRWRTRSCSAHRHRSGRSRRRGTARAPICQNSHDRHSARAGAVGRQEGAAELLGQVQQDRAGLEHPHRRRPAAVAAAPGSWSSGLTATKPLPNCSPSLMRISQASYSAPAWPSASSSSSITVTLTPLGVPSE